MTWSDRCCYGFIKRRVCASVPDHRKNSDVQFDCSTCDIIMWEKHVEGVGF